MQFTAQGYYRLMLLMRRLVLERLLVCTWSTLYEVLCQRGVEVDRLERGALSNRGGFGGGGGVVTARTAGPTCPQPR